MAMILDAFISKFIDRLIQMVQDEVGTQLGIPGEIEKLSKMVGDIQCVLADAEKKQYKNSYVKLWFRELKDVMYDAEDFMDLCQIKAQERPDHQHGCGFVNLRSCFRTPASDREIHTKIKKINLKLEYLAKQKADLGLRELGSFTELPLTSHFISRKADPVVLMDDDIVGEKIEEDARLLVSWLVEEEHNREEKFSVIAIVGMAGIGKTTLAKRVFNDPKMWEEFQIKFWLNVPKEMNAISLLRRTIEQVGGHHHALEETSELLLLLQSLVEGKKIFMVLDDIWREENQTLDQLLRAMLMTGAHGSQVLVTTRDEGVAMGMRAAKLHRVKKLTDDDGWSLLIKQVSFRYEEQNEIQKLKDIGLLLVQKCDGLPLAIKCVGGVLCTKQITIKEWQRVLWTMKELPEVLHQTFYLSYEELPSPLKQCFITCSLYPEDFTFSCHDLIYLWLAEGFLPNYGNLWELGKEYYKNLLMMNLLEVDGTNYDQAQCKMHKLLWSFARSLGKDENYILREGESIVTSREFCSKLRRLSIEGDRVNLKAIVKEKWLRTLLVGGIPENALADICINLSNLHILDLSKSFISTLPDFLDSLKHLRYLDASNLGIKTVPESIGNLRNLIYLNFFGCLDLSYVPASIINLKQLRYLCFIDTDIEAIPVGIKNLEELIHLYGFKPDNNHLQGYSSLDELEALSQLAVLNICGLERLFEINTVKKAKLSTKQQLQDLTLRYSELSWKDQLSQTNEMKAIAEAILNELSPPPSLKILEMDGYFGKFLPNWLNIGTTLPYLRYLYIQNCNCFENLAPLGQLPNLDFLKIEGAYSVKIVGEEFLGIYTKSSDPIIPAFPKLNKLVFQRLPNWKRWKWSKGESAMPNLKNLSIISCPQLESFPEGLIHHANSLEYLEIDGANNLNSVENFSTIKEVRVFRNPNLEKISNLPGISKILIEDCSNVKTVWNLNESLQLMELVDSKMEVLPEFLMQTLPNKLIIDCSEKLLRKITSQGEGGSEWKKFKHILEVKIISWDESLYATYRKTPFSYTSNFN